MKSKNRDKTYSGFLLTFEPERTKWIADRIGEMEIKESFSSIDNKFEPKELVFLVLDHEPFSVSAISIMEKVRGSGGSAKIKMRFSHSVIFKKPNILLEEIGCSNKDLQSPETIQRIDPHKWDSMVSDILSIRRDQSVEIIKLIELRTKVSSINFDTLKGQSINEQRDGLGLALEIAEIGKKEVLGNIQIENYEEAKSVLDIFDSTEPYERDLVDRDASIFRSLLESEPAKIGFFSNEIDRTVRVMVSDKTPIEEALGVDLVIYNACYDSYLLLQYKRMKKVGDNWIYRITSSSNIHDQLSLMKGFHRLVDNSNKPGRWGYRLNSNPFYFKFCERRIDLTKNDALIRGITLNEEHFRIQLNIDGPNNLGTGSIGYEDCSRYLCNTEFIQLAKGGWIGASGKSSELIKKILKLNSERNKTAMLAIIDVPRSDSALRRGRR